MIPSSAEGAALDGLILGDESEAMAYVQDAYPGELVTLKDACARFEQLIGQELERRRDGGQRVERTP
jgi:hypothetical protein